MTMKSLFNQSDVAELLQRVDKLSPDSRRQWGKMEVAQMLAHCNRALETAMGKHKIDRVFIGRILAPLLRSMVLGPKPFGKNSPTDKSYIFKDQRVFENEKDKMKSFIKNFYEGGPTQCTTHPHPFFGKFKPEEWAIFEWKHLDHHLRQFGV